MAVITVAIAVVAFIIRPRLRHDAGRAGAPVVVHQDPIPKVTPPTRIALPTVAVAFADGRIAVLDANDGAVIAAVGNVATPAPLVPGTVELSTTDTETFVAVRGGNTLVALPARANNSPGSSPGSLLRDHTVDGHSPATTAGKLAWVETSVAGDNAIVVRDHDGDQRWPAAPADATALHLRSLSWAPDGQQLAFEADGPAGPETRILDTARPGTLDDARRLGPWRSPRWVPDGDLVVLDATGTLATILDPDSLQGLSDRIEGADAVAIDADTAGDLLAVRSDGQLTVNGRTIATNVVGACWRQ